MSRTERGMKMRDGLLSTQAVGFGALVVGLSPSAVMAQGGFDNDHGYMLIGDPGNRDTNPEEVAGLNTGGQSIGGVEYVFRMARLEMTLREQVEFIEAYSPYYYKNNPGLFVARNEFASPYLEVFPGKIQFFGNSLEQAGAMGWEYEARYANWLHHGKVNEEWAFETGVYDTIRFECEESPCDYPETRNPGSRYWIPNWDERAKCGYWDPNKNGVGGYWKYPNGTDQALLPGFLPENGGQRNSNGQGNGVSFPLVVGSYPNEFSPWGLLDIAGGEWEWTEHLTGGNGHSSNHDRAWLGSAWFMDDYNEPFDEDAADLDRLGMGIGRGTWLAHGVRLGRVAGNPADLDGDGQVDFFDISVFINRFISQDMSADFRADGVLDADDVRVFLGLYEQAR